MRFEQQTRMTSNPYWSLLARDAAMVSFQDIEWNVFPCFVDSGHSTLLSVRRIREDRVAGKSSKDSIGILQEKQRKSARSARLGKRLDADLKSWLDNVIIPALVREYLAEVKEQNRLATTGSSEVTSDKGR
jgi:hypothetical protein